MPSNMGLRVYQWGAESSNGTAVAATERCLLEQLDFTPNDSIDRTPLMRSYMVRETGDEIVQARGVDFSGSGPLLFEQIHTWLSMSVQGGVSSSGGAETQTWAFSRSLSGLPALDAVTFERRITDGSTNFDREAAFCLVQSLGINWSLDGPITINVAGFGRRWKSSTLTSLSGVDAQPVVEKALTNLSTVTIDDTYAGLGSTAVTGRILGGSLNFLTGAVPQPTMDGRSDLDFTTEVYDASQTSAELTLRIMVDPAASANGDIGTETTKAEAAALRAVQIAVSGTDIGGGTDRSMTLSMLAKHTDGSLSTLGTENGQDIIELSMVAAVDGTNPWFGATVINGRDAICDGTAAS